MANLIQHVNKTERQKRHFGGNHDFEFLMLLTIIQPRLAKT